jgi:uncharacterized protein (TIGR03083 family)
LRARSTALTALRASVERLRSIVEPLDDGAIGRSAYPSEWTIAQVMSHLGSGAVILQRRFDDQLAGITTPDELAPRTWDEWNAKTPRAQVDDGLAADADLLAHLEATNDDQRERFSFSMGPMTFDFDGVVGLRLNEHAFHTWDIAVDLDPSATIPEPIAALVVDNLALIVQFTARPGGDPATVRVRTTEPERLITVELSSEGAVLAPTTGRAGSADLELPAEAFARLIYGRLDPLHTPAFVGDPVDLDRLRAAFPGP